MSELSDSPEISEFTDISFHLGKTQPAVVQVHSILE